MTNSRKDFNFHQKREANLSLRHIQFEHPTRLIQANFPAIFAENCKQLKQKGRVDSMKDGELLGLIHEISSFEFL